MQRKTTRKQAKPQDNATSTTDQKLNQIIQKLDELDRRSRRFTAMITQLARKVDLAIWEASAHNPIYQVSDSRTIPAIRDLMVREAVTHLLSDSTCSERSHCQYLLHKYEKIPGAYDDLNAFRKQVNRVLKRESVTFNLVMSQNLHPAK